LQLAGQQTLPFVRKTTKDVDNENLGNTNTGSDMQELQSSESTGTNTPTSEKQSDTSLIIFILYQAWPHDSPVEGEEPYLFWGH
jgi:hypothetical protein